MSTDTPWPRAILHADMDAFFASIAQRDDPSLRGKPVLVAGTSGRGVVAAASYEARKFGCRSAMPTSVALRKCPDAICVKVPGEAIREASHRFMGILHDFSDLVQSLSVDEAFVDVTGSQRLFGTPIDMAKRIRQRVADELCLTCSIGVAYNKFLAKLASDMDKPDGLTVITPDTCEALLRPLPIARMWGIGPRSVEKFQARGYHTFADLRDAGLDKLQRHFGDEGARLHRLAHGLDDRRVVTDRQAKSFGQEQTFSQNLDDPQTVRDVLLAQVEHVAFRLRRAGGRARGVNLKIRYGDFQTISRSTTLEQSTDRTQDFWEAAAQVFNGWLSREGFQPVRLIGFSVDRLGEQGEAGEQLGLFTVESNQAKHRIDETMDAIVNKFGQRAVHRGHAKNARLRKPWNPDDHAEFR